jgi:hypothetical protein
LVYHLKPDKYSVLNIDANVLCNKANTYNEIDYETERILVQILMKANEEANKGKYELIHDFDWPFSYHDHNNIYLNGVLQFDSVYNLLKNRSKKLKNELIKRSFRIELWESELCESEEYKIHISWDKRIK